MVKNINGKQVNIPDSEIKKYMADLDLTESEAVEMWLDDNDYTENSEQIALDEKAKKVKINRGADGDRKSKKTDSKPREKKISDEKKTIYSDILALLSEKYGATVLIDCKKIELSVNGKHFTVDLVENRTKK